MGPTQGRIFFFLLQKLVITARVNNVLTLQLHFRADIPMSALKGSQYKVLQNLTLEGQFMSECMCSVKMMQNV